MSLLRTIPSDGAEGGAGMTLRLWMGLSGLLVAGHVGVALACGAPDAACTVPLGRYFGVAPAWHDGDPPRPAVIFLHGSGGSGATAVTDPALADPIVERGYVLLAPTGQKRPGHDGDYWSTGRRPPIRDERAFLQQVLDDAAPRFHLDRSRVFVTGFSMGGGLVWQLACHGPTDFAAFGPIAGGFWYGLPTDCGGPVKMLHTHGWRDDAVPIEGWERSDGHVQGDLMGGMQLWRRLNGCADAHADGFATGGTFWARSWSDCTPGAALTLVLHPGGHEVPDGWATMALDWFETVVPASH